MTIRPGRIAAALLLAVCMFVCSAAAEQTYEVYALSVGVTGTQFDVLMYADGPVRTDTLRVDIGSSAIETQRVQPASSAGVSCSYLVLLDMPKLKYVDHENKLLASYKETLSFIVGSLKDGDNAALMISGQDASQVKLLDRAAFFDAAQALGYTRTPDTLNASIADALAHFNADLENAGERRVLIVLTDAQEKSEANMPLDSLLPTITPTNVCVYTIAVNTSQTDKAQLEALAQIAGASVGGRALACARDADENERKLMQKAFTENEARFYQAQSSLAGLSHTADVSTVTITVADEAGSGSASYDLGEHMQAAILEAVTPEETAPPEIQEQNEEQEEEEKPLPVALIAGGSAAAVVLLLLVAKGMRKKPDSAPGPITDPVPTEKVCCVELQQADTGAKGRYELRASDALVLGRVATKVNVVIDDKKVSAVHARITFDGTGLRVEDCGSTNGTRLNGLQISAPCVLQQGDEIAMGRTALLVTWHITER